MKVFASLLIALGSWPTAFTGARPDNCCCRPADGTSECSVQKFCTRDGGNCTDSTCDCSGGGPSGPSPTITPPTCPNTSVDVGGPQIAMAWVSDQFANFDMEHTWSDECNSGSGNVFKCCHDWLVDSFAGINTVSLTFLKPTEIMNPSTCVDPDLGNRCTGSGDGVRKGLPGAIEYFYSATHIERVFLSIGGATYTDSWEEVLLDNATMFALKVVDIARYYNVGIEIDYEESAAPLLTELGTFMQTYRDEIPFDDSADPYPPSLLTIDFGQGAQFMGPMADWLANHAFDPDPSKRLINWANAMVAGGRQSNVGTIIGNWGQHVNGYSTLQTAPIAPAYLVVSVWSSGGRAQESCIGTSGTDDLILEDPALVDFITNVEPCIDVCGECKDKLPPLSGGSYTKGILGYAYWMCGNISPRRSNTCPTSVSFDVYGTVYDGDGDCTDGFTRAANKYGEIGSTINWTARVY